MQGQKIMSVKDGKKPYSHKQVEKKLGSITPCPTITPLAVLTSFSALTKPQIFRLT